MRCGRSMRSQREVPVGSVETTTSSQRRGSQASMTAQHGSTSPSIASASIPAACSRSRAALTRWAEPSWTSCGSRSVTVMGPRSSRAWRAAYSSSESTVWLATTRSLVRYMLRLLFGGCARFRPYSPPSRPATQESPRSAVGGAAAGAARATRLEGVGEAPRDARVGHAALLLPQRDDHQLAVAGAADEDQRAVDGVADVERAAVALLDAPGLQRAHDTGDDLLARVQRPGDALAVALNGVVGHGDEHRYRLRR